MAGKQERGDTRLTLIRRTDWGINLGAVSRTHRPPFSPLSPAPRNPLQNKRFWQSERRRRKAWNGVINGIHWFGGKERLAASAMQLHARVFTGEARIKSNALFVLYVLFGWPVVYATEATTDDLAPRNLIPATFYATSAFYGYPILLRHFLPRTDLSVPSPPSDCLVYIRFTIFTLATARPRPGRAFFAPRNLSWFPLGASVNAYRRPCEFRRVKR